MKTILFALALLSSAPAFAGSTTYACSPFHGSDGSPSDWKLPETFEITIRGSKSDAELSIAASGKTSVLESDPFTRHTPNSDKFDRYSAKGVGGVLVAKEAASLPDHFTAKLAFEADSFHGVGAWFGYNCR
ncbi:MAG: hypothetical protein ACXWSC_02185 [Bdellovibrionota bacterium]